MKCLVTGAAGFIGSHLTDKLIESGHDVIGIDNFVTGQKQNIAHLSNSSNFDFIEHDAIHTLPDNLVVDFIFHFASAASPPKYQQFPIETLLVNSQGTYNLLERALKWNAGFLYASSSEIYGDPQVHPQTENYWGYVNPIGPRSCYDEGKRFGEAITTAYVRKHSLDGRLIRIFNTYGPRMDLNDGRVVTNFIQQALRDIPLTLYGDGQQTRSFCYVSDLVDGIVKVAFTDAARGEVFNLGNPSELTISKLAKVVQNLTGVSAETTNKPLPQDDPTRRRPDISKAKKKLSWKPEVSLHDGLTKTIDFFRNQ